MNEKRFKCVFKEHETKNSWSMIKDNQLDKPLYIKDVVDLLNEQQTIISQLKEENEQLRQSYKYADELLEEIREVFEKNGVETGYNKRILETCFSALYENEQLRQSKKILRANKRDCEYGRKRELEQFEPIKQKYKDRIRFLEKRLIENGLSIYRNVE